MTPTQPTNTTLPISVEDCCAGCAHLNYQSDEAATCVKRRADDTWPALFQDDKATSCDQFEKLELTVEATIRSDYEFAEMVETYMEEHGPMTDDEIIEFVKDDLMQETGAKRDEITVKVTRNNRPTRFDLPHGCAVEITDGQAEFIGSYDLQSPGSGAALQVLIQTHALAGIDVASDEYHRGVIDFLEATTDK